MRSHLTAIVLCAWSGVATAQTPGTAGSGPTTVDLAGQADVISDVASKVKSAIVFRPNLVISGDYQATTPVVGAKEIIFKPGARIVFNDSTPNTAGAFFVIADKITVEDPSKPGVITWVRTTPSGPPDRGQAGPGGPGAGDGAPGGNGAEGAPGTSGTRGQSSPAITVFVRTIANGGLVIDAVGGAGGPGGTGQAGGQGGPGAQGSHARQARHEIAFGAKIWDPWCEAGPGTGGAGGRGGAGGPGGLGGPGGPGGNVTLVSLPQNIPTLFQVIRVNQGGGSGGPGGAGGSGGAGGPGGPEGQLANFCNSAGRVGPAGPTGPQGPAGPNGEPGRAGQPFVAQLDDKQFAGLFGF